MSSLTTATPSTSSESTQKKPASAKRKSAKLKVGTPVKVHDSVTSPDFPDISFGGWTGSVVEVSGRKSPFKYFIEWDQPVVDAMPQSYVDRCEEQQIYYRWACLTDADFAPVE